METLCTHRDVIVAALSEKFQESLANLGLISETHLLEVFVSSSGSWTIVISNSIDAMTCMIASGQNWQLVQQAIGTPL
jgi:hypothetical protein